MHLERNSTNLQRSCGKWTKSLLMVLAPENFGDMGGQTLLSIARDHDPLCR